MLLVTDAAQKYIQLKAAVVNELGPQHSEIESLPIKLNLSNNFTFQKLINAINKSTNKLDFNARYAAKLSEAAQLIERNKAYKVNRENKARQSMIARQEFEEHQRMIHKRINDTNRDLWEARDIMIDEVNRGDQICTHSDNKVGFVEAIEDKKLKVLWKAKVQSYADGFMYGNMSFTAMDQMEQGIFNYQTVKLNETTWVSKDKLSICSIEI